MRIGHWPGNVADAANRAQSPAEQLTLYTNAVGKTCSTTIATFMFGTYLKSAELDLTETLDTPITANKTVLMITGMQVLLIRSARTHAVSMVPVAGR